MAFVVLGLSLFLALFSHLATRHARSRAEQRYAEIMAPLNNHHKTQRSAGAFEKNDIAPSDPQVGVIEALDPLPHDPWREIRSYVGVWGCLFFFFAILRGAALLVSFGTAIWIFFG